MSFVAFSWFSGKEIKNGGYTVAACCAEGLHMLEKTVPGLQRAPHWLLNESLVTWKCSHVKSGINLQSQGRESALSHAAAVSHALRSLFVSGPFLRLYPFQRWQLPWFLVGITSPLLLVQPSPDCQRWVVCPPLPESQNSNDMGHVRFCVVPLPAPPKKTGQDMFVSIMADHYFARQAVNPHVILGSTAPNPDFYS